MKKRSRKSKKKSDKRNVVKSKSTKRRKVVTKKVKPRRKKRSIPAGLKKYMTEKKAANTVTNKPHKRKRRLSTMAKRRKTSTKGRGRKRTGRVGKSGNVIDLVTTLFGALAGFVLAKKIPGSMSPMIKSAIPAAAGAAGVMFNIGKGNKMIHSLLEGIAIGGGVSLVQNAVPQLMAGEEVVFIPDSQLSGEDLELLGYDEDTYGAVQSFGSPETYGSNGWKTTASM